MPPSKSWDTGEQLCPGSETNKTYCVALVMPSLHHPFFAVLVNELSKSLMEEGYRSLLMITSYGLPGRGKMLFAGPSE